MSLLAVDIGNSHTVLGLLRPAGGLAAEPIAGPAAAADERVEAEWRVATHERHTADDWAVLLRGLLGTRLDQVSGIVVCATVPTVLQEWRAMLERHFPGVPGVVVEPGVRTGIPVQVDNPREVGTDRIVNAVAAAARFGGPAVVVDVRGTATTVDVVNPRGAYVGGAIAPGLELSLEALGRRGAQLRKVELTLPRSAIGKNTVEALQAGLVLGAASMIDGLVARSIEALGVPSAEVHVVITGYLADLVAEECRTITDRVPWLTLLGLGLVFDRNA